LNSKDFDYKRYLNDPIFDGAKPRMNPEYGQAGFSIEFPNGMTMSVQWGANTYSSVGRGTWDGVEPPTFETAAWYPGGPSGQWFNPRTNARWTYDDGDDQVQGYQTPDEVLAIAQTVAAVER
jgi:hypothetical protein